MKQAELEALIAADTASLSAKLGLMIRAAYVRAIAVDGADPVKVPPQVDPPPPPPATGFRIGATVYKTMAEAAAAMKDGDALDIAPADYPYDCAAFTANGCTINCNGATFHSIFGGKATFVIQGNDTTINHPVGRDIHNTNDGNGGLIRMEGQNLTVNDFECYDSDMPYLGGKNPLSVETFNRPKTRGTKQSSPYLDNVGHHLYFGPCAHAIINEPDIVGSIPSYGEYRPPFVKGPNDAAFFGYAHLVKSRAAKTTITGGQLIKGEHTSRCIDCSLGGILELSGVLLQQGPVSENPDMIGFGSESPTWLVNRIDIAPSVVFDNQQPKADPYRVHAYIPVEVNGIDPQYVTKPERTQQPQSDPPEPSHTNVALGAVVTASSQYRSFDPREYSPSAIVNGNRTGAPWGGGGGWAGDQGVFPASV